jgi:hypothetical protein
MLATVSSSPIAKLNSVKAKKYVAARKPPLKAAFFIQHPLTSY